MATRVGSGRSLQSGTARAAEEAIGKARAALGDGQPHFGLVFSGPDHDLAEVMRTARAAAGGADLIACTTAGEFTEDGLTHGGVAALLVTSDEADHSLAFSAGLKGDHARVAEELASAFPEAHARAQARRHGASTTILLTDGLAGTAEKAVAALRERTGFAQQIVGGAAGDEGRFKATAVGAGERVASDAAAALHVFSRKPWGVGLGHGLQPSSARMHVTRASGNVLHQIDGRPAFDAYRDHAAGRGVQLEPQSAGSYMIGNELGIFLFDRLNRARAPLSVGADGSLNLAAEVPQGASICILDGQPANMVAAAREAAQEAARGLEGHKAAGVVVFDCVCRGMILRDQFQQEIDAVRDVFGAVPVAGFLTYGEIARYGGKLDGWHNATAVVVAIPA
jgi:methyl-accepting chemotaxis protein